MGFLIGRGSKARETYPETNQAMASVGQILAVIANHHSKTFGNITGGGSAVVEWTDDAAITSTPGAPGNFVVDGGMTVVTSAPGQRVTFTLLRNGGSTNAPEISVTSDAVHSLATADLSFIDEPGPGAYTYELQATNIAVGGTISGLSQVGTPASAFLNVQETF